MGAVSDQIVVTLDEVCLDNVKVCVKFRSFAASGRDGLKVSVQFSDNELELDHTPQEIYDMVLEDIRYQCHIETLYEEALKEARGRAEAELEDLCDARREMRSLA